MYAQEMMHSQWIFQSQWHPSHYVSTISSTERSVTYMNARNSDLLVVSTVSDHFVSVLVCISVYTLLHDMSRSW